jgi:hypothetical protein
MKKYLLNEFKVRLLVYKLTISLVGVVLFTINAQALCASPWYSGWWNCSIDGRPSTMVWEVRAESQQNCYDTPEGPVCSRTDDICRIYGWFKEESHGSSWFRLNLNRNNQNEIFFTYTGDNTPWYLRNAGANRTQLSGHTTWQGHQYPLSCNKR